MSDLPLNSVICSDCLTIMKQWSDNCIDCCITSPPYFGLRNYLCENFIGLEPTLEEYIDKLVVIFKEVRRILKPTGTLWLNIANSYCTTAAGNKEFTKGIMGQCSKEKIESYAQQMTVEWKNKKKDMTRIGPVAGFKNKDLLPVAWLLAQALQQPYYTGKIKNEKDRVWLAAMIEAEGCMFIHKRKAGDSAYSDYKKQNGTVSEYNRTQNTYGAGLEVANTDRIIVERCMQIAGIGSICKQSPEDNPRRKQTIYRWNVRSNECRWIIEELYPHFIAKQLEARLVLGCPSSGIKAAKAHESLKSVHQGGKADIDFPAPKSLYEPGFYLRNDIIYAKLNPMPESCTDRCTKSHEYLFLLTKSPDYYFDADAIKEDSVDPESFTGRNFRGRHAIYDAGAYPGRSQTFNSGSNSIIDKKYPKRNKRDVWTVTVNKPKVCKGHFAVFPEKLIEPCILAGCPVGGIVLDPFCGSGTTCVVAKRLNHQYIGIDISETYCELSRKRLVQTGKGLF